MRDVAPPKSPLLVTAIQLGLLLLAIYYTFIGGQTAQGIYDHRWRSITLWLTTIIIGSWLLWRFVGRQKIPRTSLDFPLLFILITWIPATIFSVNPTYSQEALVFFVIYLFFFYLAADLGRWPWFTELLFNAVIAVSGLVWTLAVWQLLRWYQNLRPVPALLHGSEPALLWLRLSVLGNPNTMASFIALVFPIVLYKLISAGKAVSRLLLMLWVVMLVATGLLTQSRGGIVGLIVAGGFYLIIWWWQRSGTSTIALTVRVAGLTGRRAGTWLLALGLAAGFGLVVWLLLNIRGTGGAVGVRQQVMAGALKTLQAHPLIGAGPGTLGEELIRRQQPLDMIWADAHNLPLTLVAETGLIGLIGLIWLAVAGVKALWSTFKAEDKARWNMASMACLAALLGFMTHNMVDSLFKFPLIMVLVVVWAGFWLSPRLPKEQLSGKFWGYPLMAAAALILIATTLVGMRGIRNIEAYNRAVEAAGQSDWEAALAYLKLADQLAPRVPFYQRQLGFAAGYLSALPDPNQANQNDVESWRQLAMAQYRAALDGVDRLPIDHANLACLLWLDDQAAGAIHEMSQAHELELGNTLYGLNLGYYLEQAGQYSAAWEQYAAVLAARPDYLQSSFWRQSEPRASALPDIMQQAAKKLTEPDTLNRSRLIELQLYAGDIERARQIHEAYPEPGGPVTAENYLDKGRILWAQGRLAEARQGFETVLELEPANAKAYLMLSKVAMAQNHGSEAVRYIDAARFLEQSPEIYFQAAMVAEAAGDGSTALEFYETAIAQLTVTYNPDLVRYATEVARRRPLPVGHLPCLMRIYPTALLTDVTLAEGNLLEQQGNYSEAGQVYHRLLQIEPDAAIVHTKLETLCRKYPDACDFRAN